MKEPMFTGTATALITPFRDGKIDFYSLDRLLELQLEAEIDAIIVCGTTGEASTLDSGEKVSLWKHAVNYLKGRTKIIAGTGTNNTNTSVLLSEQAADCGVDGLLAVTPYYNKCSQEGLYRHYIAIADAAELPLITYNVPSRTGVDLLPETCAKLMQHPNINGIKEAGGNISRVAKLRQLCKEDFYIWSGNDDQIVPMMSLGAVGVISVLSNLCPKTVKKITDVCQRGDYSTAADLQIQYLPLIEALFSDVNPIPIKKALEELQLCSGELRMPLTPLSERKSIALLEIMRNYCIE